MNSKKILLIEDDPTLRNAIEAFLIKQGYELRVYDNVSKAMKEVGPDCHLILSDVMMPGLTGYDLLGYVRKHFPTIPVILMTGYGTIEKAVEAMKNILNAISKAFNVENEKLQELNAIYPELNKLLYRKYVLRETVVEG